MSVELLGCLVQSHPQHHSVHPPGG